MMGNENQYRRRMVTGVSRYAKGKNRLLPIEARLAIMAARLPEESLTQAAARLGVGATSRSAAVKKAWITRGRSGSR
jgi:hypothetical protein